MVGLIRAAALAVACVLAFWWHSDRVKAVHGHYALILADIADKTARAQAAFRARETAWQTRFDKESKDGQNRIDAAQRDAAGARRERDGLRADLDHYRAAARAATNPGAAAAGNPAADAVDVLSELFKRADEAAGELAQAADMAHAAGLTCQRAVTALQEPSSR